MVTNEPHRSVARSSVYSAPLIQGVDNDPFVKCRECVEQLLTKGADSLAYNLAHSLPCDLAESGSLVWAALGKDMHWRTTLQARLPPVIRKTYPLRNRGIQNGHVN